MSLNSISDFCGEYNQPGLIQIEYLPISSVDRDAYEQLISSNYNWQKDIQITTGEWLTAPVVPTSRLWNETMRDSAQGPIYEQTVRGTVPNLKPTIAGEFMKMEKHRFLLRIADIKNRKWILGTLESPFRFFADGTSGENGSLKHHTIRFVSQTASKAYGFTPVL